MGELTLPEHLAERIAELYGRMEDDYNRVAKAIDFSCRGCPDNCCDSYFLHHSYAEWAYLWRGLRRLEAEKLEKVRKRAKTYQEECRQAEEKGERPLVMCPLNEEGLCILYAHRLLVCRTHGVPARMRRPDGRLLQFPGCFRCQELVGEREKTGVKTPGVDRTPLLTELARVEEELLHYQRNLYPKVRMTIADMILAGPPAVPPHCER